jgi:hypothetical protein
VVPMSARTRPRYTEKFKQEGVVPLVREFAHPVAQVCRDLGTPDNVLYPWASQHRPTKAYGTTRAYELYIERGCREGCTLEDWLDAERETLIRSPLFSTRSHERVGLGMLRRSHGLKVKVV